MRRAVNVVVRLFFGLTVVLLVGCGGHTPAASSRSFLYADRGTLAFLGWSGSSGRYILNGSASAMRVGVQGNTYTFRSGVGVLVGTLRENELVTPFTDGQNRVVQHRWYAGTEGEYRVLLSSLVAYQSVQKAQLDIQHLEGRVQLPDDSRPSYFQAAVRRARQRVLDERTALGGVKAAGNATCSTSRDFLSRFPLPSSDPVLQFPFSQQANFSSQAQEAQSVMNRSTVAHATQTLIVVYQRANALPLAHVAGLPVLWRTVPTREMQWGLQSVQVLAQEVQQDVPLYASLQQDAQQVRQQVEQIQQAAYCG